MNQSELKDLLLTTAPFDQLANDEIAALVTASTIEDVPSGAVILEIGDQVSAVVFVLEGQIEVSSATG